MTDGFLDENAVLDGDFKVRGVNNLRVVDASSWPNVPGYFVTTPIYMVGRLSTRSDRHIKLIFADIGKGSGCDHANCEQ